MIETQEEQRVEQLLAPLRRLEPAGLPPLRQRRGVLALAVPVALVALFVLLRPVVGRSVVTAVVPGRGLSAQCGSGSLRLSVHGAGVAAGTTYYRIVLRNVGGRPCRIAGYPSVVALGRDGRQVGAPAVRDPTVARNRITLRPGAVAHATLGIATWQNFTRPPCRPMPVAGLRVDPPGPAAPVVMTYPGTGLRRACSATRLAGDEMTVQPVTRGRG